MGLLTQFLAGASGWASCPAGEKLRCARSEAHAKVRAVRTTAAAKPAFGPRASLLAPRSNQQLELPTRAACCFALRPAHRRSSRHWRLRA